MQSLPSPLSCAASLLFLRCLNNGATCANTYPTYLGSRISLIQAGISIAVSRTFSTGTASAVCGCCSVSLLQARLCPAAPCAYCRDFIPTASPLVGKGSRADRALQCSAVPSIQHVFLLFPLQRGDPAKRSLCSRPFLVYQRVSSPDLTCVADWSGKNGACASCHGGTFNHAAGSNAPPNGCQMERSLKVLWL